MESRDMTSPIVSDAVFRVSSSSSSSGDNALKDRREDLIAPPVLPDEDKTIHRTTPRPMWYTLLPLLVIFSCLVLTAGVRCKTDPACGLLAAPSLGNFLNNTDTSALAVSSLNVLIGVHYVLNVAVIHLLKNTSSVAVIATIVASIFLYIAVYGCLIFPYWYIAVAALSAGAIWACGISHGLRKYYAYQPARKRILFICTIVDLAIYVSSTVVYIVLSAMSGVEIPDKNIGIFVVEIALLASGVLFCALLVFHTRGVSYLFQLKKDRPGLAGYEEF